MFYKGKTNDEVNSFKSKAQSQGLQLDKIGHFQSSAIGLDKKQGMLCYFSEMLDDKVHTVDLNSIAKCEVLRFYNTENVHHQDISMLKSVYLHLKTIQKSEINIPIFDSKTHIHPGNDLLEAIDWVKIINTQIKSS
jgi:hypothetical protein